MDEPVFKAPTPPSQPQMNAPEVPEAKPQSTVVPPVQETAQEQSQTPIEGANISENTESNASQKQQVLDRLNEFKKRMVRYFWYSMGAMFLLGAFFGCAMSGPEPSSQQPPRVTGISARVVQNPMKKGKNLKICGETLPSQPCLYYILNTKDYDKTAKDFYKQASEDTQRLLNNIHRDNIIYSNELIKPGSFAEIIIPSTSK